MLDRLCFAAIQKIRSFNLSSGLNFLINPLQSGFLWHPSGLLMNYPLMLVIAIVLNLILRYVFPTNNGISSRLVNLQHQQTLKRLSEKILLRDFEREQFITKYDKQN